MNAECTHVWLTPEGMRTTCKVCGRDGFITLDRETAPKEVGEFTISKAESGWYLVEVDAIHEGVHCVDPIAEFLRESDAIDFVAMKSGPETAPQMDGEYKNILDHNIKLQAEVNFLRRDRDYWQGLAFQVNREAVERAIGLTTSDLHLQTEPERVIPWKEHMELIEEVCEKFKAKDERINELEADCKRLAKELNETMDNEAELEKINSGLNEYCGQKSVRIAELEAENERLRELVRKATEFYGYHVPDVEWKYWLTRAREALGE